jgi:methyl-accepting chemotaxis protein
MHVLRDAESKPCGAAATWTTLAETQDQQRSSLRSTLDRIPLNALLADREARVAHVNGPGIQSLRALYPARSTEWTGRPLSDVFGSHPRLSAEDESLTCSVGEETVEVSALPLTGSHVVTSGWLVVWRVSTAEGARGEALDRTAQELSSATEQLTVAAVELISNADDASDRANRMLDRTREVTDNTHSVANATEQMSGTINEISLNTRELAEGIVRAVSAVGQSREIAEGLRDAGREISRVSETISSIADQTNLLALNATIEAAGAGEAGRGFAVVANEVKELARETMSATGAIDSQVQSMIKRSEQVAQAVGEVAEIVQGVNDLATTLATAIEEQSATTNEIASSVSYAAASATQIGREMETLFEAARSSTQTAEGIRSAAEQLNEMAQLLDEAKQEFTPRA